MALGTVCDVVPLQGLNRAFVVKGLAVLKARGNRGLAALADKHDIIGDVRGLGVFWAVELVKDRATKEPLAPYGGSSPEMGAINARAKQNGLLYTHIGNRPARERPRRPTRGDGPPTLR